MLFEVGGIAMTSSFIAGLLMFLAPCTLPLVPAYLGFISGVSSKELSNPETAQAARRKIFRNGIFFILGFTAVFIFYGTFAGYLGSQFAGFQLWSRRIGGVLVVLFGLFMLGVFKVEFLNIERRLKMPSFLTVGKSSSSFLIGSSFAVGWTPCVGPILAGILTLAAISSTAFQGAFLLAVFSSGLAIPFLLIALGFSKATKYIERINQYVTFVSLIGGIFLIALGVLLLTDNFGLLIQYGFQFFEFLDYDRLYDYL